MFSLLILTALAAAPAEPKAEPKRMTNEEWMGHWATARNPYMPSEKRAFAYDQIICEITHQGNDDRKAMKGAKEAVADLQWMVALNEPEKSPVAVAAGRWRPDADGSGDYGYWQGEQFVGRWFKASNTFAYYDGKTYGPKAPLPAPPSTADDALCEINALRSRRGLRAYLRDEGLTIGAKACAAFRARHLMFGHVSGGMGDFQFVPAGTFCSATGCAAYPPSDGWLSCCIWDGYTYAGAAWSLGTDGKRYMSLFCR